MIDIFGTAQFIKPDRPFDPTFKKQNYAPMFRQTFMVDKITNAKLYVCGLGYAYYYINGKPVSPDLFTAPVSNYEKTLWYLTYDVSDLLVEGENIAAVICGNGWYNEEFASAWDTNKANWRDLPKFILRLNVNNEDVLISDNNWKCLPESATYFNALRSGEYFDAMQYNENWNQAIFDDTLWEKAVIDSRPPCGIFRECLCEPIREIEVLDPQQIFAPGSKKYIFDMGQNISGYIRITVTGNAGDLLTIRYAERLKDDLTLDHDGLSRFYPESEFQTDRFICSGKRITWSPRFTYHGFRYIEIEGLDTLTNIVVQAVFVHQAVESRTSFHSSSEVLNKLFHAGQMSSYSNMFYLISDCPTREKLGWTNDTQMSTEQFLTNFKVENLMLKWLTDIHDAMLEDGALPGIVPTHGWGYHWGNGPLSDGAMFEIPYRVYLHTGNKQPLIDSLPWFDRYLTYLAAKEDEDGKIDFGLGDWATAGNRTDIPVPFVNMVLQHKFYNIAELSATLANDHSHAKNYAKEANLRKERLFAQYLTPDGSCVLNKQAAVAILLYHGLYVNIAPLKIQLKALVEKNKFHHDCGLLGVRCLFEALNDCGLQEYAMKILLSEGFPSYRHWLEQNSTTLWEHWKINCSEYNSSNHHMYSNFMSWIIKTVLGIYHDKTNTDLPEFTVAPYYFKDLDFADGSYQTDNGKLSVRWERKERRILLTLSLTGNIQANYLGTVLSAGTYHFTMCDL